MQNDLQRSIHQHHWNERAQLITDIAAGALLSDAKAADRLAACGQVARFYVDEDHGRVSTTITRCMIRMCPYCTKHRTAAAARQVLALMRLMKHPRVLVLTLRSTPHHLDTQLTNLRNSFRRLRSNGRWKERVVHGIYAVEVTWNKDAGTWHPHVHVIYDGAFFPKHLLTNLWREASRGSDITWIQDVKNPQKEALELAAYIGKPANLKNMPAQAVRVYAACTRGLRMLQPFGKRQAVVVDDVDKDPAAEKDRPYLTVNRIRFLARAGETHAHALAELIPQRWPQYKRFLQPDETGPDPPRLHAEELRMVLLEQKLLLNFVLLIRLQEAGELARYDQLPEDAQWQSMQGNI